MLISGEITDCMRGQSVMSLESWANTFKWSIQQVRTFLKLLQNDEMITVEGLKYATRITICNYERYQNLQQTANTAKTGNNTTTSPESNTGIDKKDKKSTRDKYYKTDTYKNQQQAANKLLTSSQQTDNILLTTNKNIKNVNNEKNERENEIKKMQKEFSLSLRPFIKKYGEKLIADFYAYWAELNLEKTKLKFQMEETWDTAGRLRFWEKREKQWQNKKQFSKEDKELIWGDPLKDYKKNVLT